MAKKKKLSMVQKALGMVGSVRRWMVGKTIALLMKLMG